MRRTSLATTLLAGSLLAASAIAAQMAPAQGEGTTTVAATVPVAATSGQAKHDAVAVAVIGALKSQFEGREVEFRIDALESKPVSRRDVALTGRGDIRIEGSGAWLPVRFQALYDTATLTVLSPSISLDQGSVAGRVDVDARALEVEVDRKLAAEFASQAVAFDLADVQVTGGDSRHAVVSGRGIADFGTDGEAPVQFQAVYDLGARRWIQVDYALGAGETFESGLAAL